MAAGTVYIVVLKNSKRVIALAILLGGFTVSVLSHHDASAQASTAVNAIICSDGASITLTSPISDSIVTDPVIAIAGQSVQASQIEVYVNDQLDSIMSIPVGETAFSGTVTLVAGTSTVKVVAVDVCQLQNDQASSVVTFNPPPDSSGSTGGETQTDLPGQGVVIGGDYDVAVEPKKELPFLDLVPPVVGRVFESLGNWLNISTRFEESDAPKLTLLRATTIAVGSWILAFGIATTAVQWLASSVSLFQKIPVSRRIKTVGVGIRFIGLGLLLLGIFL
ncbi:hypothetical protein A3C39_01455 [Candidatus Saccharibacteria bacterium RIFCSPHIGHO2_02_FULL_46_12]|nr:MAG: hypothetical protein A3C39_01455 [Candidatus Saccharibacteria bacterium RIFCSPHIGHO2_02_FULL_46_12]